MTDTRSRRGGTCRRQNTAEQDEAGNKCCRQHDSNPPRCAPKRQNHTINIILVSAAIVLLTTNIQPPRTMSAQAFDPSSFTSLHAGLSSRRATPKQPATVPSSHLSRFIRHTAITSRSPPSFTHLYATDNNNNNNNNNNNTPNNSKNTPQSSWSKAAMVTSASSEDTVSRRRESRIGVRRRVKSVLKKARRRTGIRNNSEGEEDTNGRKRRPESSISSVVADAASIGGLGAVIVDEETGEFDVAFDFIPPSPVRDDGVEGEANARTEGSDGSTNGKVAINGVPAPDRKNGRKTPPASTYSPPLVVPEASPHEALVVASPANAKKSKPAKMSTSMEVLKSDVSAAFSLPPPPLPFSLPKLNTQQKALLQSGDRVQFQSEMGNEGSGFVVLDVRAPESVVWDCLLDFKSYPETIPTVQNVFIEDDERERGGGKLDYGKSGTSRAMFTLSKKLRLKVSVVHKYRTHPCGDYLIFELNKKSTNFVLNKAKGVWYTESKAEGLQPGSTRIWLLAELKVSRILPRMIVDYAARKAFPRATTWIKPHVETAASLWLRPDEEKTDDT